MDYAESLVKELDELIEEECENQEGIKISRALVQEYLDRFKQEQLEMINEKFKDNR